MVLVSLWVCGSFCVCLLNRTGRFSCAIIWMRFACGGVGVVWLIHFAVIYGWIAVFA